jgi:hypothetical protein
MAYQEPHRGLPDSNLHVIRLQQPSPVLHKYFSPVRAPCIICHVAKLINFQASPEYSSDLHHASNLSSQVSACSVEPGSAGDMSKIVSHPNSMRHVLLTIIFIATYPRTKPNPFRSEMWRTCYQPGILLLQRSTDLDDTLQRHKSRFHIWNS